MSAFVIGKLIGVALAVWLGPKIAKTAFGQKIINASRRTRILGMVGITIAVVVSLEFIL